MTEKIPPHLEDHFSRKNLDEYSTLLDELARIRKDIEQEFLPAVHMTDLVRNHSSSSSDESEADKPFYPNSFQRFYRFDFEHLERNDSRLLNINSENSGFIESTKNDSKTQQCGKEFKASAYHPEFEQTEEDPEYFSSLPKQSKIKQHDYHLDEGPVLIPIHRPEARIPKHDTKFAEANPREIHQYSQDGPAVIDFSALPWGLINQYENENFVNMAGNAGNLSLFIGWGAIACGVVIFARSFFVSSMIWLKYGLPVIALGAVCLFLGIILSILADKMQHINDLKQSLSAHRILNQSTKKNVPPPVNQSEHGESEDIYGRLIKLRSEINELIDECENP